jgi:hypothetical protein
MPLKIPAYQIQNVLRLYFRQMGEGKILEKSGRFVMSSDTPRAISSEGTRQAIIDKVAAGIVEKIISKAAEADPDDTISCRRASPPAGKARHQPDTSRFTYRLIDRHNHETIQTAKAIQTKRGHSFKSD